MVDVSCKFDFHPVGQGLFCSGAINDFRFVYDCGTDSGAAYTNSAISRYDQNDPLDLLIISHFHADHMNAVRDLLARTKGVKEVVLPYLFPAERLMVAAEYSLMGGDGPLNDDYVAFLTNPLAYIAEASGDNLDTRVTFLWGERPVLDWPEQAAQGLGNYGWLGEPPLNKADFPELTGTPDSVTIRNHSNILRVPLWGFKFYCQPGRADRHDIEAELRACDPPVDPNDIPSAVGNRLKDLKDVYMSLFGGSGGQNSTSVICCHGPASPRRHGDMLLHGHAEILLQQRPTGDPDVFLTSSLSGCVLVDWFEIASVGRSNEFLLPPVQMLMGDANIGIAEYQQHFRAELDLVGAFLLPHHGAKGNWRNRFIALMPRCQMWVASFGLGNKHKHPSKMVVDQLVSNDKRLLLCNEIQGLGIEARATLVP